MISNRNFITVPNKKSLATYIPFYFGVQMPMLYVVQKGFNHVKITPAEDIIYCVTSVAQIIAQNLDYVFTDGHAVDSYSTFYDEKDIDNIENCIDKKAITSRYWKEDNDLDLKRRKEAEFLVGNDIPRVTIRGFAVYNEKAKQTLIDFGVNEKILVKPEYYF